MTTRQRRLTLLGTAFASVSVLTLAACGGGSESADGDGDAGDMGAEFITIATGGSSGVYYQIGATLSDMLAEELGSDTSVQATGASAENINLITDGNAELAFTMGDATVQALEGTGPFEGEPRDGLVAIGALYPNTVQLIATAGSGIESVDDLEGRNVAVGDVGSGVELNAQMVLGAYDMDYDDINADYLDYGEATDQMANGHIEALFATSGLPNPALTELATSTDFVTVPIDGDGRETLLSEYEFFEEEVIPADTYKNEDDVETVSVTNHLLASTELSEDAVYDITAAIFDNIDRVHASHSEAEKITLETITEGLVVPLHPGAAKYYEEQGLDLSSVPGNGDAAEADDSADE